MTLQVNGRIGIILLAVLGIIVGIGMVAGFSLPTVLVGLWLAVGAFLTLIGT